MIGFNVSEAGHPVSLILPINATGGQNGLIFSMYDVAHVSILIVLGATAGAPGIITLNACTSQGGANPTAIGFRYYKQTTAGAGNDKLTGPTVATAAGFTPANTAGLMYTIELDAAELDVLGDGDGADSPYLQLVCANGANANLLCAVAILSGLKQQYQGSPSQTV